MGADFDGSDAFWAFVREVNWEQNWQDLDAIERNLRQAGYRDEGVMQLQQEYSELKARIVSAIKIAPDVDFGGGDDYTYMDLPGEIIGRGREVFLEHVTDSTKLSNFGQNGAVNECFAYIFQAFDTDPQMSNIAAVLAAQPPQLAPSCRPRK